MMGPIRRRLIPVAATVVALALLAPSTGSAQEVERVEVLTLAEAMERAARHNPAFRRTTNDLGLNRTETRSAWLELLPTLNVNLLNTNTNWNRTPVASDIFGNPVNNPETGMIRSSQTSQGGALFFTFDLTNLLRLRQQEILSERRELTVSTEGHALRTEVAALYLTAQETLVSLELEQDLLDRARTNLDAVDRLFALARRDRTDLLGAELEVAEQEGSFERAEADHESALLELRTLIGDSTLTRFTIDPVPLTQFDPSRLDEERMVAEATTQGPRVRQAEASVEVEERNRTIQRAQWLPTLSLSYTTSRTSAARQRVVRDQEGNEIGRIEGGEAFFDLNPDADWGRNFGLTVSFPNLGTWFNRSNAAEQTGIAVRNQRESLREARLDVEREIRTQLVTLRSSHRDLLLQERRAALAEERLNLTSEAYRIGQRTFLELQAVSRELAQARRAALQARFNLERARVTLERSLGMSLDGFLRAGEER